MNEEKKHGNKKGCHMKKLFAFGLAGMIMLTTGCSDKASKRVELENYAIDIPGEFCKEESSNGSFDADLYYYTEDGESGLVVDESTSTGLSVSGYVAYMEVQLKNGYKIEDYNCEKLENCSLETYKISYQQTIGEEVGRVELYVMGETDEMLIVAGTFSDKVSEKKVKQYSSDIEEAVRNVSH